jgi:hypothetical protein
VAIVAALLIVIAVLVASRL